MRLKNNVFILFSVLSSFFVMGIVDIVGVATNYVKNDFCLSDSVVNILPSMIFLWFLLLSIPAGVLMNKIGCRKTVMLGILITVIGLLLSWFYYDLIVMLFSFSLLGIGNVLIQVSLNPLLSNIITGRKLASFLTLGQFVKAISSFIGPIIAAYALLAFNNWRIIFLFFAIIAISLLICLSLVNINEQNNIIKSSFCHCIALLKDKFIFLLFLGIICHVGMDVGINVTLPKLFMEKFQSAVSDAGYSSSIYFFFRTLGCFAGAFFLIRYSVHSFFKLSLICLGIGLLGISLLDSRIFLYCAIACLGIGNSNIFSIILSKALLYKADSKNEISSLMVMGLLGGAVFPLIMGTMSDLLMSQLGAVLILIIGFSFLLYLSLKIEDC